MRCCFRTAQFNPSNGCQTTLPAPRTPLDDLTRRVTAYFRSRAADFGLQAASLEARYILNWGGFVNASFTLTDGAAAYHLKLADDAEMQDRLALWYDLNEILSGQYRAPRILDWIEIPDTPYAGLLFPHLPGEPADLTTQPDVLAGVLDLLARLHADSGVVQFLAGDEVDLPSCADYFRGVYIERFDEDLQIVAAGLPPFVPPALLDWMLAETRALEHLALSDPAFQHPAASPTHSDLWHSNILVAEDGGWHIIDWDDLTLGDPALEYSILLGRLWQTAARTRAQIDDLLPPGEDLRRRFDLCLRAFVLDQVIDTLADWVESDFAPQHQLHVRQEKERAHREALELYRRLYPEG
jgi:hypothetical protein